MAKKDFRVVQKSVARSAKKSPDAPFEGVPEDFVGIKDNIAYFPENTSSARTFSFSTYYNQGYDEVLKICQDCIEKLLIQAFKTNQKTYSYVTIISYCNSGLTKFFDYCSLVQAGLGHQMTAGDINKTVLIEFISYLKSLDVSPGAQKTYYNRAKHVLINAHRQGRLPLIDIKSLFPKNPFPNSNRKAKGQRPLGKNERRQIVRALNTEMKRIYGSDTPMSGFDLSICVLSIGLSTGMNPAPVLTLQADCVQPHPLKSTQRLLVAFKRRGNATQVVSLRQSQDLALIRSVKLNVVDAIDLIVERNADFRKGYSDPKHLLVYQSKGQVRGLTSGMLKANIKLLIERHRLTDDDGKPMTLNMMRLRKTFVNRIWELSGQDPLIAARHGKHTPETANQHYWEAPPEAEAGMRFIGEIRIKNLLETNIENLPKTNTPVAGCRDNIAGHRAPKNGTVCTELLGCFRCKSFVVTDEDLYRLLSFYWAVVRERDTFGAKRWKKYLRHIIRIIDEEIAPKFDAETVKTIREKANREPHPYWRNLDMVRLAK